MSKIVVVEIEHEEPIVLPAALLAKGPVKMLLAESASDPSPKRYELTLLGSELVLMRLS